MTVEEYCKKKGITTGEWAEQEFAKWPKWKQELLKDIFAPYPPRGYEQNYSSWND